MSTNEREKELIFQAAAEFQSPNEREAYLDSACGDDAHLRAEILELLRHDDEARSFLDRPAVGLLPEVAAAEAAICEAAGDVIGPYRLTEQIGEGAFGRVFAAQQEDPVRRKVAIKCIKPGMDTREVIARFEAERQALALMDHPHIARVFEAGATAHGRPYFVMELVPGVPIVEYCDQCHLTMRERLALFVDVCQAVQHAHQKGIIHRDLKPTNVLVSMQDGRATPKVIDFGIAKAIDHQLTEETLTSAFAKMVGTPLYMSPEQAELSPLGVDTRSDIYSLGVLLYELLTGTTPFDRQRLKGASCAELQRIIREEEPPRPSTRISTIDGELASTVSEQRRTDPRRHKQAVRGDLDWIVMKCLEKDRGRRYASASALARDIERFLGNEPIEARPPSVAYKVGKFARRNAGPMIAAALVLVCLVGGIVGTTLGMIEARRGRDAAETARQQEEAQRQRAEASATRAKAAAEEERRAKEYALSREQETQAILSFVDDHILSAARPEGQAGGLGTSATIRQTVEAALPFVQTSFTDRPLLQARLQTTLGVTFYYLGDMEQAAALFEAVYATRSESLGAEHPATLQSKMQLALSCDELGRHDEAIELGEQAYASLEATLGPEHGETLSSMTNFASTLIGNGKYKRAADLCTKIIKLREATLGRDDPSTLTNMHNLALCYRNLGRHKESVDLHEETLGHRKNVLGETHPDTLKSMHDLAHSYERVSREADAQRLLEETCRLQFKELGPDHPETLGGLTCLANSYRESNRTRQAVDILEKLYPRLEAKFGPTHPATLKSMQALAVCYLPLRRPAEAVELLEKTLKHHQAALRDDHPQVRMTMNNLAVSYQALGSYQKAAELSEKVIKTDLATLGADHPDTLFHKNNLAVSFRRLGRWAEAVELNRDTLARAKKVLGVDDPETLKTMHELALSLRGLGDHDAGIELYLEVLSLQKKKLGPDHRDTLATMGRLSLAYLKAERFDDAADSFADTLKAHRTALGGEHPDSVKSLYFLADVCRTAGNVEEGVKHSEDLIALMNRIGDPGRFRFFSEYALWLATSPHAVDLDPARAEELARQAVEADADDGGFWYALGAAQLRAEHYRQAVDSLTRARKLIGDGDSSDWFMLAIAEAELGNAASARAWYDRAASWMDETQPGNADLARWRAKAREALGLIEPHSEPGDP